MSKRKAKSNDEWAQEAVRLLLWRALTCISAQYRLMAEEWLR
jgi:hypothetical protein